MENPGYLNARAAMLAAGLEVIPAPVDREGLDISRADQRTAAARLVYITPSHQFPLCVTMSLARRLQLLEWARRQDAWIIEDDYDSEFRFSGRPLAALQGLDLHQQVVYIGTFAKTLAPGLRTAYLVVPERLIDACAKAIRYTGQQPPPANPGRVG